MVAQRLRCPGVGEGEVDVRSGVGKAGARTYPAVDAPLCPDCQQLDLAFFDPSCPGCQDLLKSDVTTTAHVLAIMRQWVPQTQQNIELLVNEVLRRGANVNDRDSLTDMTLLQYACKAGASGVGDVQAATRVVQDLLSRGADIYTRCRWTHMTALHYAAYFDVAPVVRLLLKASNGLDVDNPCHEYDNGTSLHITASNLCLDAAKVLIEFGADLQAKDDLGRTPLECTPDSSNFDLVPDVQDLIDRMCELLATSQVRQAHQRGGRGSTPSRVGSGAGSSESISGRAVLQAIGLKIGDRVLLGGSKVGTLRYCGTTEFSTGIWAGIELDTPDGKNDGSVKGVMYFKCSRNHGIFAPINRLTKLGSGIATRQTAQRKSLRSSKVNKGKVDVSKITSKIAAATVATKDDRDIRVGERVTVLGGGRRTGVVRFCGGVEFSPGWWYGVELDLPMGKNDGSVRGVRYFSCEHGHGVFAPPSRVQRVSSEASSEFDSLEMSLHSSLESASPLLRRSLSVRHRRTSTSVSPLVRSGSVRQPRYKDEDKDDPADNLPPWQNVPLEPVLQVRRKKENKHWLEVGMNVLVKHQVGVIKYIGPSEFSDGVWLGLELRNASGRHDGQVNGKRYYTCKPNHGVMVRPSKVTVRGINGANLVKSE